MTKEWGEGGVGIILFGIKLLMQVNCLGESKYAWCVTDKQGQDEVGTAKSLL